MCTGPPPVGSSGCGDVSVDAVEPFLIDITATVHEDMAMWGVTGASCGDSKQYARTLVDDMDDGKPCYVSEVSFVTHLGTHIDMPSHFLKEEHEAGNHAETVDLSLLMGPVLVMDLPVGTNVTGEALRALRIPADARRLILKTENTAKGLMHQHIFDSSYIGFTKEGARYLAQHTGVTTIGIDYLSIARYDELTGAHVELFKKHIMVIEGLVLDAVSPGWYTLTCLPLKLAGAEGVPARCVLTNAPSGAGGQASDASDDEYANVHDEL
ncbi:hypothetical protein FOA52_006193 [Chlamydomonas sp. UWO 241]|nr:hypothetical protein FOA52_006193 [Chlamydomonas sp. UWO 241]